MNPQTDEHIAALAVRISRSDRKAFDELFRLLYPGLIRFAQSYTRDNAAAYDIVQDAFVNLWQRREQIDEQQSLRSYIYTSVKNRSLNAIRKDSALTFNTDLTHEHQPDHPINPTEENGQHDLSELFNMWISQLPDRQREAFELSRHDGLDHNEIAKVMDVSPKTVNNHIVLALQTLKGHYQQYKENRKSHDE
jgi:RNA polymerase sigma-70 factor (ECF subfamily)